jgi:hypothetical protein
VPDTVDGTQNAGGSTDPKAIIAKWFKLNDKAKADIMAIINEASEKH